MISEKQGSTSSFLEGGGEMGQIIREKNWSSTPIGSPDGWPLALKFAISTILHTKFPKLIYWGKDRISFYNDAFRPSLGNEGKHPFMLGKKGKDAFPEIWDIIDPLLTHVWETGEATWSENQLIPIFRNGKVENVYWTFSYSRLLDDDGRTGGILTTCTETTEAVLSRQKLEESENQLKFAIEAAELATYDHNPITKTFTANARLKDWFDIPQKDELELQMAINAIAPADQQRVSRAISNALSGHNGGKYDITYTILNNRRNKPRIVHALGRVWFNENNEAYRLNGVLQDVTAQVKSEKKIQLAYEKIRIEERRFRNIIQNAPTGIAIFKGKEPTVVMVNDTMSEIVDESPSELIKKPLSHTLPEMYRDIAPLFEEIHRNRKSVRKSEYKISIKRKGKIKYGYFDFMLHPINADVDDENELEVMMVDNEVTDYIIARNTLAENESQFRNLVFQSPIAMAIFRSEELRIEMANHRILNHFWNRTAKEVIGRRLVDVFPELKEQKYLDELAYVIQTGNPVRNKESKAIVLKDNKEHEFYVDYHYLPLTEIDGSVSGVIITVTDVTEYYLAKEKLLNFSKELENKVSDRTRQLRTVNKELQDSVKKLENANTELASFAYISSHDLQEPLRKIQMYTSRITEQKNTGLSEAGRNYFDKISIAAGRMRNLIDDLLVFSNSGDAGAKFESTDLDIVIKQVLENLSNLIESSGANVMFEKLPVVQAIPFQMRQVFENLIGNALKFAKPDTSPVIAVKLATATAQEIASAGLIVDDAYHRITVVDSGIGFEEGMETKIFEVFQRLHGKSEYQGTGIGLAIVKKIIENHGGRITAKSIMGESTTFSILLPVQNELVEN